MKSGNARDAARANTQLGVEHIRRGEWDLAVEKLRRATAQNPADAPAHAALAYAYEHVGNIALADAEYRRALELEPADGAARNNYGVFLCGQNRIAEAERNFSVAVADRQYATPAAAWTNAGVCLRKSDPARAEQYFRQALQVNADFPDALANLAWIAWSRRDYLRARAFLQRHEASGPPTAETLWLRAQTERALGDAALAEQYAARLKSEFPEYSESSEAGQARP